MKAVGRILYILAICFVLWFMLSYFEINMKNATSDPQYSEYNCFMLVYEIIYEKEFKK
jgi:nitrate/nitrite transporter NarK